MSGISGSVGQGGANYQQDVRTVQVLLNKNAMKMPGFVRLTEDGLIGPKTIAAITQFQRSVVGFGNADGRVDVNGKTWNTLLAGGGGATVGAPVPTPIPTAPPVGGGQVLLTVSHGGKIPSNTNGSTSTHTGLYESTFVLSGALSGTFSGSIYPDNMDVKGRVVDGSYPLHIGFHKGGGGAKQTVLQVKKTGVRCGLLVNCRNSVPVQSNLASKTTSVGINVHNGFTPNRASDGCLTIPWEEYQRFIKLFIDGFPDINDWHTIGTNSGKKVGTLVIQP